MGTMVFRKRGKGWLLDVYFDGVRRRQMISPSSLGKETAKADEKLQPQLFEDKPDSQTDIPLLSDFIDEHFLPWSRVNKRSWYCAGWRAKSLKTFFAGKRLNEITPMLIEKFKNIEREAMTYRGTQQTHASVNRKIALLSRILSMAVDYEMIPSNPCRRVRKFRLANRR